MDFIWKVLVDAAKRSDFKPRLKNWRELWPTFCGSLFADVSTPCALSGEILYVEVKDPVSLQALEREKARIESKIQSLPWGVDRVEFIAAALPRTLSRGD